VTWGGWDNFVVMGGYAFYVWGSYGVTAAFIIAEVLLLRTRMRKAHEDVTRAAASRNGPAA